MGKLEKQLQQLRDNPVGVRKSKLDRIARSPKSGVTIEHGADHDIYKRGVLRVTVPRHREVDQVYVRQFVKLFDWGGES